MCSQPAPLIIWKAFKDEIVTTNLTEQTYEALLQMIIKEKMQPGSRLPSENELSDRFGVSRNTLRAAINKLNVLGFTDTRRGGGTFVKKIGGDAYLNFFLPAFFMDAGDVIEVLEFRKGIEVQAVKLAAERATKADIKQLKSILDLSHRHVRDMEDFAYHNTHFHSTIAKASHNQRFEKMMAIVRSIITTKMQDYQVKQGHDIDSDFYHSMIFQCIANNKPDEAALMMDKHLTLLIERVRNYNRRGEAAP